jgi:hypothetical protein
MSPKLARVFLSGVIATVATVGLAQDQVYPAKKPTPTEIYPELFVFGNEVIEEQWKATLELVNGATDLKQLEPGQCVRFGILASGDDRDRLLASATFGFELTFAGQSQKFAIEPPEALKKGKPEGGDFVTHALGAAGIKNPIPSMVSVAASRSKWCVPVDARDGTLTVHSTVSKPDGKSFALKPRRVDVKTFEAARKTAPFKDMSTFGPWLQRYHAAPDPANLLPGLRIVAFGREDEVHAKHHDVLCIGTKIQSSCGRRPSADALGGGSVGAYLWHSIVVGCGLCSWSVAGRTYRK